MVAALQMVSLAAFECVGDRCEDTCCRDWDMAVGEATVQRYADSAPALLEAFQPSDVSSNAWACGIMQRDAATGYCKQCSAGWCSIQRDYGSAFLGDACHFFPRIIRNLGHHTLMSATLSCPEIARIVLNREVADDAPYASVELDRLPVGVRDYRPEGLGDAEALQLHQAVLASVREGGLSPEMACLRVWMVGQSLATLPFAQWNDAFSFLFRMSLDRIPAPESHDSDLFNLVYAFEGICRSTGIPLRERCAGILDVMARVLGVALQDGGIRLTPEAVERVALLRDYWRDSGADSVAEPFLERYLYAQIGATLFPFAGLGAGPSERACVIAFRFATIKFALMAESYASQTVPTPEMVVRVVQAISRVLDHLASPDLVLAICAETGWARPARMRGLLGV